MSPTRRDVLRGLGLAALATPLAACATTGRGAAAPSPTASAAATSAANPFGVDAARQLEVVIFSGGNGDKYAVDLHQAGYRKLHPQAPIKHVATQKVGTQLRPRFIAGDVPDVVNNSGPEALDLQSLVQEGHLADLTPLFEAPSLAFPDKKVKDTLVGGAYENSLIDGVPRVLQYTVAHRALWYNAKLFAAKGWNVPKTWAEFNALGEEAKKAGIALFAYPGQVGPFYQLWNLVYSAAKIGGNQVIIDIDNLADGAWTAEPVKQAVAAWAQIQKDYGDKAYFGLDHTQTQVKHLQDKVLFYPCGSWLENEMAKDKPDTFEYAIAPVPSITAADVLPYEAIMIGVSESFFVSAKGKNPQGGLEYLRVMLSKDGARGYTEMTKNLTIVNGLVDGLQLTSAVNSAAKAQEAAGKNTITDARFETWYKELFDHGQTQTNSVMAGRITAEEFCANMQKKADELKADSSIAKQTRSV
ncbi:carbohydrate ABC transporter, N-acetylglucosamine/diacetylchitobiose-binding protein [Nonomuraea sp. NN258]|uniref:N-acetylglucosamine/diacetylchitobiose ABC transporter substrate-binding protein n=1 Tax=Nonomuraea antri TaxID=2730852 RepID=UPI001568EA58|nr:N-acetylglucosamine/diacetylchitobiose ABC transporter substrate-binding protein [Nonomuraea antri]NRQ33399.1 carbohydrate ABC transporter, N-acetylglucosamine/diacetylchitobiose-binding protein [Nonomuraea antri]